MKAHYLQHVPFEGLGCIAPWLEHHDYAVTATRFYAGDSLPDPATPDLLIIMGGPMGVSDREEYPWLIPEMAFIREVVLSGKPVLGICLGAQLIAAAMGAKVYQNREKEIGWFPVETAGGSSQEVFAFPPSLEVFHWHGETFDLPAGAVHLARSQACQHQAFQIKDRVMGLQFHLETTPESAKAMVAHCGDELKQGPWLQSAGQILEAAAERCPTANRVMDEVLAYLTRP